jgi:hypothetical protein
MYVFHSFSKLRRLTDVFACAFPNPSESYDNIRTLCTRLLCVCWERTFSFNSLHFATKECKLEIHCDIAIIFSVRFTNENVVCHLLYPHTHVPTFSPKLWLLAACFFSNLRTRWRRRPVNKSESN